MYVTLNGFPRDFFLSAISSTLHSSCQLQLNCQKAVACFPFWLMSATTYLHIEKRNLFFRENENYSFIYTRKNSVLLQYKTKQIFIVVELYNYLFFLSQSHSRQFQTEKVHKIGNGNLESLLDLNCKNCDQF